MRLVLVEPDRLQAKLYADALRADGWSVRHAHSAQSALNALDTELPDVIVLEIDMPAHNGLEFLYEFRTYDDWSHIPIVVHSSLAPSLWERMVVSWDELNVREYLYKPGCTLADLQRSVRVNSVPVES